MAPKNSKSEVILEDDEVEQELPAIDFAFHGDQQLAWQHLHDPKVRELYLLSGIQGGKTIFGAFAFRELVEMYTDPSENFIIGAPNYKIMNQSTFPTFRILFSDYVGHYDKKNDVFILKDGRHIYFRTDTDPDSVEGVPNCRAAWMDEAGKCSVRFYVNFLARVARLQGKLIFTSTWYALNWMYKRVWKPWKEKDPSAKDIRVVYFPSSNNPAFPKAELERQRAKLPPAEFQMKYGGEPGRPEGIIFDCWDPEKNKCDRFTWDSSWKVIGGVDWGFDHPFAIFIMIVRNGVIRGVSMFKKSGLTEGQQLDLIEAKHKAFGVNIWGCGHDRPGMILSLNNRKVRAVKYFEGFEEYREINSGNSLVYEHMKMRHFQIFRDCPDIEDYEDELDAYVWDRNDDDESRKKERPIDTGDDMIAAVRYAFIQAKPFLTAKVEQPKIPHTMAHQIDSNNPLRRKRKNQKPKDWTSL